MKGLRQSGAFIALLSLLWLAAPVSAEEGRPTEDDQSKSAMSFHGKVSKTGKSGTGIIGRILSPVTRPILFELQRTQKGLAGLRQPLTDLREPIVNLQTPIEQLAQPLEQLEQPLQNLSEPIDELKQPLIDLRQPVVNLSQPMNAIADLREPIGKLESPFIRLNTSTEMMAQHLLELKRPLTDVGKPVADLVTPVKDLNQPISDLKKPLSHLPEALNGLSSQVTGLQAEVTDLKTAIVEMARILGFAIIFSSSLIAVAIFSHRRSSSYAVGQSTIGGSTVVSAVGQAAIISEPLTTDHATLAPARNEPQRLTVTAGAATGTKQDRRGSELAETSATTSGD